MSVWRNLIPQLHSAGASDIFPRHNALTGQNDPKLFAGVVRPSAVFAHGYQSHYASTAKPETGVTACVPTMNAEDANEMVQWERASERAYKQAMYLTIGLGSLLFAINVWFLVCLFFCRSKIKCCVEEHPQQSLGPKEFTCETELATHESVQSFSGHHQHQRQRRASFDNGEESLRLLHQGHQSQQHQESDNSEIAYTISSGKPHSQPQQPHLHHTLDSSCRLSRSPSMCSASMKRSYDSKHKLSTFKYSAEAETENSGNQVVSFGGETILQ